jgi:hypothetical protein
MGGLTQTIQLWNGFGNGSCRGIRTGQPGMQRPRRQCHVSEKTTIVSGSCVFRAKWTRV